MVKPELMNILCCPETKQDLYEADEKTVELLNKRIAKGEVVNRSGRKVTEKIDGGLIRSDDKYLYPVRADIPVMLIDEGIASEYFS
ncbi:MAG: Trm112 family protein [Chitinivibrionales bacterium]